MDGGMGVVSVVGVCVDAVVGVGVVEKADVVGYVEADING